MAALAADPLFFSRSTTRGFLSMVSPEGAAITGFEEVFDARSGLERYHFFGSKWQNIHPSDHHLQLDGSQTVEVHGNQLWLRGKQFARVKSPFT